MKTTIRCVVGSLCLFLSSAALADWHTVTISSLYYVVDTNAATPDLPAIRLQVFGTFEPQLPCTQKGFVLIPNDPLFKETYAMLLAAKMSSTPIRYHHMYCTASSGLGRGNILELGES